MNPEFTPQPDFDPAELDLQRSLIDHMRGRAMDAFAAGDMEAVGFARDIIEQTEAKINGMFPPLFNKEGLSYPELKESTSSKDRAMMLGRISLMSDLTPYSSPEERLGNSVNNDPSYEQNIISVNPAHDKFLKEPIISLEGLKNFLPPKAAHLLNNISNLRRYYYDVSPGSYRTDDAEVIGADTSAQFTGGNDPDKGSILLPDPLTEPIHLSYQDYWRD